MAINLGIIGATGLVGRKILEVLEEKKMPLSSVNLYSSDKSAGQSISYSGKMLIVEEMSENAFVKNDVFISSAGAKAALKWGEYARKYKKLIIDNSSAWRMDEDVPLIVPEINPGEIKNHDYIIANPNCSTIQLVLALFPLQKNFGIARVVVSTYQSVSGNGKQAVLQLAAETAEREVNNPSFPHRIAFNCLPHIDVFLDDGYTREEHKMMGETSKILAEKIPLNATCVRVPVYTGHSESVNVELKRPFQLEQIYSLWRGMPGVVVQDNPKKNIYPMPINCENRDEVFIGRLRCDNTHPQAINFWVVSDNLRKGAATNAVQILKLWMEEKR